MTDELRKHYLQWDELAWSVALSIFEKISKEKSLTEGIEIAANKGGMSLFFANELNIKMKCTDLENPELLCSETILLLKDKSMISFDALNALNINIEDNSIDMLVFKSFLGGLLNTQNQQNAILEIYRVLKPGGVLFFAENLKGSWMHQTMRNLFVSWSNTWHYINLSQMKELLSVYSVKEIHAFGFFSIFYRIKFLKKFFYQLDKSLNPIIPSNQKYITYGYAIK